MRRWDQIDQNGLHKNDQWKILNKISLDNRLQVEVLEVSKKINFRYRTFRFQNIKTIDQRHQIHCRLHLTTEETIIGSIQNCTCYSNESCDSGAWSYWSDCDGDCKQTRIRNKDEADEETESRDCQGLCFFNVNDDIDENLKTCPIDNNRSRRDIPKQIARLSNGSTAYPGSLPYVVRLTFQTFDQFHSDSQACFPKTFENSIKESSFLIILPVEQNLHIFCWKLFEQYNLCAGTVILKHWILTSATCCKLDDIVNIKFNDYSGMFQLTPKSWTMTHGAWQYRG